MHVHKFWWIARVEQKDLVCGYLQTSRLDMICWSQSGVCESVIETKLRGSVNVLARCAYALTFLQPGADYEVAVDWRWRRLGDSFWMYSTQTELQQLKQKTPRPLAQSTTKDAHLNEASIREVLPSSGKTCTARKAAATSNPAGGADE